MRLIDADALIKEFERLGYTIKVTGIIDNAPTVEPKFELKTENGITYPKALDNMTFSHILSVEERQNIIQAYMLGANATARPHGKWIIQDIVHCLRYCSECRTYSEFKWNFCPNCGADLRGKKVEGE